MLQLTECCSPAAILFCIMYLTVSCHTEWRKTQTAVARKLQLIIYSINV
uniref:Uncharacterized protein n=1 Tax=Anguilla anguilla TaxID=7936 RepID=A0A0E9Y134_ANGAN